MQSIFTQVKLLRSNIVLANTFATLLIKGSTVGNRLVIMFLLARGLSPANYGKIAFAFSIVEVLRYVADFGMDTYAVREFATHTDLKQRDEFAKVLAFSKIVLGSITYGALIVFFVLKADQAQIAVGLVLGLLIITTLLLNLPLAFYQARLAMQEIMLTVLLTNFITISGVGLLITEGLSHLALWLLPASELCLFVLLVFRVRRLGILTNLVIKPVQAISLIKACAPLAATAIIVALYTRLDTLALGIFGTAEMIGYYNIAFRFTEPFMFVATYLVISIYAHLSQVIQSNGDWSIYAKKYLIGIATYAVIACVGLLTVAKIVLEKFLPNYLPALTLIYILAAVLVLRCINAGFTTVIQAWGKFKTVTYLALWNILLISILIVPFIHFLGVRGAAISLLIVELVNTSLQLRIIRKLNSISSNISPHSQNEKATALV